VLGRDHPTHRSPQLINYYQISSVKYPLLDQANIYYEIEGKFIDKSGICNAVTGNASAMVVEQCRRHTGALFHPRFSTYTFDGR